MTPPTFETFADTYPGEITDRDELAERWHAALRAGYHPADILAAANVHGCLMRNQGHTPWPAELFLAEVGDFIDNEDEPDEPPTVSRAVRAMRHGWGWTQAELSCRSGVSLGTVQHLETDGADVRMSTLSAVAGAFGMTLVDLLGLGERFLR